MKLNRLFIFLCVLSPLMGFSQKNKWERSKEIGLVAGTAYYIGDLNPYKHFGTRLQLGGGLSYRNNINRRWTVKSSILYASIEAWDEDSDNAWMRNRNLHFKNQLIEGSLQFELNFFDYQIGNKEHNMSPYLFAGIAYFQMKPMANYKGNWYELQALGTEGQGTSLGDEPYRTGLMSVPFGVGFKTNLFAVFGLSLEWGVRKTWTDYFDDVSGIYVNPELLEDQSGTLSAALSDRSLVKELQDSDGNHNGGLQRGDPGRKDFYFFFMASLNIRIDKKANSCWK